MTHETFLDFLGEDHWSALSGRLTKLHFSRGEIVIAQEDQTRDVFFVLEGLAKATIYSADGKMVAYRDIGFGSIFGELAAIDDQPRSATVVAVSDLTVGRMSQRAFQESIKSDQAFTAALLRYLAEQSRFMTARIFEFSTMLARQRLIHELLRLAEPAISGDAAATIAPAPTHFDLAARISSHREVVSREMSRLAKQGILSRSGGQLIINDLAALREEGVARE